MLETVGCRYISYLNLSTIFPSILNIFHLPIPINKSFKRGFSTLKPLDLSNFDSVKDDDVDCLRRYLLEKKQGTCGINPYVP